MINKFKTGEIVRLVSGQTAKILNVPGTFMSNGSYEITIVESTSSGKFIPVKNGRIWLKPDEIAYSITQTDNHESLEHYMEIVYNGEEIVFIPKDIKGVQLITDENGFQTIRLQYEGHVHNSINILIGNDKIENNETT